MRVVGSEGVVMDPPGTTMLSMLPRTCKETSVSHEAREEHVPERCLGLDHASGRPLGLCTSAMSNRRCTNRRMPPITPWACGSPQKTSCPSTRDGATYLPVLFASSLLMCDGAHRDPPPARYRIHSSTTT